MSHFSMLSDAALDTIVGGCSHFHRGRSHTGAHQGNGQSSMNHLQKLTGALNISIIVIANSTINGNLTINLVQGISR